MFTGGDQLRLLDILGGTEFAAELLRRGRDGLARRRAPAPARWRSATR